MTTPQSVLIDPGTGQIVQTVAGTPSATADAVDTLTSRAQTALAANDNFLANPSPSNVVVVQQVQRLTRECNAIIQLLLNQFTDVANT